MSNEQTNVPLLDPDCSPRWCYCVGRAGTNCSCTPWECKHGPKR